MTNEQHDILIKNGWKQLPNDRHMWMWGNEVIVGENNAMNMADAYIGGMNIPEIKEIEFTYEDGSKGTIQEKYLKECDKCKKQTLRAKEMFEGGGVVCISKDCDYWFCY